VAAEHCPGCTILTSDSLSAPRASGRALVVLVGGAFGFGDEWDPVVAELRAERREFVVFAWPGPWRARNANANALASLLQRALAAPSLERLLVLAHSAGGQLAGWAVRQLDVPPGKMVLLASIAAPQPMNYAPYHPDVEPNTPLGVPLGGTQRDIP